MRARTYNKQELERLPQAAITRGIFPWLFYKELLHVLQHFDAKFLTVHDLHATINYTNITPESFKHDLKQEYIEWLKVKENRTYFLLLHDCDSAPITSIEMLQIEAAVDIVSTLSVFARWPYRNKEDMYLFPINFTALRDLQDKGFTFTYHCNAAHLCKGDDHEVFTCYDEDVEYLRKQGLTITWYSAHGGHKNSMGKANNDYFYPAAVKNTMPSTHNKYALSASGYYSDGAFNKDSDIRVFLQNNVTLGNRHRLLIHPCYYGAVEDTYAQKYFESHPFVKEYWDLYHVNKTDIYWDDTIQNILNKKALL